MKSNRDDASDFADKAARIIAQFVRSAVQQRGHCHLALAGGSTPRPVYQLLAGAALSATISWDRVHIFFGDERAVPPDHPESNYRMARETLLDRVPIPASQVHRMEAERPDRDAAAKAYEQLLPDRLDVLLLGMGADGHTASLFPHAAALNERSRRVVAVDGPKPPVHRLTITPPVISAAHATIVMIAGEDKLDTVLQVTSGTNNPQQYPIQFVTGGVWLMDEKLSRAHTLALMAQHPKGMH